MKLTAFDRFVAPVLLVLLGFVAPPAALAAPAAPQPAGCGLLVGTWEQFLYNDRAGTDTIRLVISSVDGNCHFEARFDGAVKHRVSGTINGTMRIDRDASGCPSVLTGTISSPEPNQIKWIVSNAEAKCGVPNGFSESRTFRRVDSARPQAVSVTGTYKHNSPVGQWSRGMATTMYCGNSPESWVRGSAAFDSSSGVLTMTVQLETDSASAGPKGKVLASLKDVSGRTLATATSDEIGTGGKSGGRAAIRNFTSHANINPSVAERVTSVHLDAQCTGSIDRLLNVSLGTVQDAFKIIVAIASL